MNNKSLIFLFTLLFLVSGVYATDIGYVVKTTANANIISALDEMGYTYDVITESSIPTTNFSNYAALIIQDNVANKNYLPLDSKNLIFLNKDLVSSIWTSGTFVSGSSNTFSAKFDEIGTPFTKGLNSITYDPYTTSKPMYYLHVYPSYITSVSRTTGSTGSNSIVAYSNEGGVRKVFFGFYSTDFWSSDGKKLFKNTLNWTRMGTDFDGDGYYSDFDCNDNDPTKWRTLPGYLDSDSDGLGGGNLLDVCSGDTLPAGYVSVGGDCNDSDPELYQTFKGYLDSDSDGKGTGSLLDVCSGDTLHEGYVTIPGDCNDSDPNVWRNLPGYIDFDSDGKGTGSSLQVCSGDTLPLGYSIMGGDCNDSDSDIWRNLPGYIDSDKDGLGTGSLLQVCSGDSLPTGYSTSSGDCNDSNAELFQTIPGYLDSDNDGFGTGDLIQVCSGTELLNGYSLIPGDCNDSDAEIWKNLPGYVDSDNDSFGSGSLLQVCSGNALPIGYAAVSGDCNDSNSLVWRLMNGYADNDLDSRGSGNIVSVCSGTELPLGYSNTGTDCNDSNPDVWRLVPGYVDSDSDNYGTGTLLDVCSGFNLLDGYSTAAGDCNDNNSNINPGALEIPYDGIDQSCTGHDSADSDSDGYCQLGYLITDASLQCPKETGALGTDCNDNNPLINPGSLNLSLNCINDKPIILPVADASVHETEEVVIIVNATDPENDPLTYSINDSRFTQDGNKFSWNTDYSDLGEYYFNITVSDGNLESKITVKANVLRTNRIPVCEDIPSIVFDEDGISELNLNNYCSDADLDNLTYTLSSNSETRVLITSLENGIFKISPEKDFSGEGVLKVSINDGIDTVNTSEISYTVNPVNDAPKLLENIPSISFNQDSELIDGLDLNTYFSDIDSNLTFNFSGNSKITIEINNGKASFHAPQGFVGSEMVIFSATDGEFSISSNPVSIIVADVNDAPEFLALNCTTALLEDTEYTCSLSATDVENDSVSFGVSGNSNLNCTVFGNTLTYISEKDYHGQASCDLRVTDSRGAFSDKTFNVDIENVNDAPKINDYYPKDNPKLIANVEKKFTIFASDVDSNPSITWKIGSTVVGSGNTYTFLKPKGVYDLTATVSDGQYNLTHSWNIIVGNMIDFKCSEVSGHICTENQTCTGTILGVSDSPSCCSKICKQNPPKFTGIEKLPEETRASDIDLEITYPETNDKVYLRQDTNVTVKLENKKGKDMDFNVEMYIYDLTKDKVIKKLRQSMNINDDETKDVEFELNLPEDTKEDHEYYLFVRATARDSEKTKYFNDLYQKVNIERPEIDIVIEDLSIEPTEIVCGDEITAKVTLKNFGNRYQYVNTRLQGEDFKFNEASESLRIEDYGSSDDTIEHVFNMTVPSDLQEGTYTLKASVTGSTDTLEKEVTLGKCSRQVSEIKKLETIKIGQNPNAVLSSEKTKGDLMLWAVGIISVVMMGAILVLLGLFLRKHSFDEEVDSIIKSTEEMPMPQKTRKKAKKK